MRKQILRIGLLMLALVGLSVPAHAALIPIGHFDWTAVDDVSGTFSVVNQTGPDTTAEFPVTTLISFNTLTISGYAGSLTQHLNSMDSTQVATPGGPVTLTGTIVLPAGPVHLSSLSNPLWNGFWTVTSNALFGSPINPITINPGQNPFGDNALIFLQAEPVASTVPEPMTLTLVGTGLVGAYIRRRRAQQL